jgi:hypothetical protein
MASSRPTKQAGALQIDPESRQSLKRKGDGVLAGDGRRDA